MLGILVYFVGNGDDNQFDGFSLYIRKDAGGQEEEIVSNQYFGADNVYIKYVLRNVTEVTIRRLRGKLLTICELQVFAGIF